MSLLEDDELTQRNGLVYVVFGSPNNHFYRIADKLKMLKQGLPSRPVAFHCCLLDRGLSPLPRLFFLAFGKSFRLRLRIHLEGMSFIHIFTFVLTITDRFPSDHIYSFIVGSKCGLSSVVTAKDS